jgi:outer membrane protein assembly factor BamB
MWKKELPYEFQFTGGNQMLGSPSIADGMVFASASLRAYYAFDVATGEQRWKFSEPAAMEFIASSPLYVDGELFIINKFSITSLNAANGQPNWHSYTGDELYTSLSYAEGKLYIMTSQRHIFILDAKNNGTKLDSTEMPSASWSSPTIANGRLYIGNHDWNVYCFTNKITVDKITVDINDSQQPEKFVSISVELLIVLILAVVIAAVVMVFYRIRRLKKQKLTK